MEQLPTPEQEPTRLRRIGRVAFNFLVAAGQGYVPAEMRVYAQPEPVEQPKPEEQV